MKKLTVKDYMLIAAAIIIIILLIIIGNLSNKNSKPTISVNNTQTVDKNDSNKKPVSKATPVKLGETIEGTELKITLDKVEVVENYTFEHTDGSMTSIRYIKPRAGMKLVCLKGNLTNKFTEEIVLSNMPLQAEFIINGNKYRSRLECYDSAKAESFMSLVPLQTSEYFLYAEVPAAVADAITSCTINLGFNDGLNSYQNTKVSELNHQYTLQYK